MTLQMYRLFFDFAIKTNLYYEKWFRLFSFIEKNMYLCGNKTEPIINRNCVKTLYE